jgi:SAM-dependent methyltransferase
MPIVSRRAPLAPNAALRFDVVDRIVGSLRPTSVLEIGCGQGAAGTRLARRVPEYLGVEPDPVSFGIARSRIEPVGGSVRNHDHTGLPTGSSYDLVCAFEVLEHLEDDKGALADWVQLIRPGGHLLLSVPAWPARFSAADTYAGHFRRYTPQDISDVLADAGLVEPKVTLYGWPLGLALEAARNRVARSRTSVAGTRSIQERTAASGRFLQPTGLAGLAVAGGVIPFRYLQRLAPTRGTGLVALARRPAEP